ncbi:IPT/TIG domain-containing protein [Actinoplanes sp. Pm04-4]|uniref:IPT/TIG domain-containing protein n=1 Tax=Paractinoplanes pyxinae TaxID=2997416 RepID=A0ABT4B4F5_9ACTN|nr:IPT/TIG domain-containing protein [Actinoplanes pyxinae]MCY1141382.1 IPT/TIG domain-containing protein [Actinoplanes pyxinae]
MAPAPTTRRTALARRMRVDIDLGVFPAVSYQPLIGKQELTLVEELRTEDDETYEDDGAAREQVTGYNWRVEGKILFSTNVAGSAVNTVHKFLRNSFELAKTGDMAAAEFPIRWYDKNGLDDGNSKEGRAYVKAFPPDGGSPGSQDVVSLVIQGQGPLLSIVNPNADMDPVVSGLNPAAGGTGAGGIVQIYGTHFTGATAVSFGGTAATNFTVISDQLIVATKPALTAGSKDVTVTTPEGTSPTGGTANDFVVN